MSRCHFPRCPRRPSWAEIRPGVTGMWRWGSSATLQSCPPQHGDKNGGKRAAKQKRCRCRCKHRGTCFKSSSFCALLTTPILAVARHFFRPHGPWWTMGAKRWIPSRPRLTSLADLWLSRCGQAVVPPMLRIRSAATPTGWCAMTVPMQLLSSSSSSSSDQSVNCNAQSCRCLCASAGATVLFYLPRQLGRLSRCRCAEQAGILSGGSRLRYRGPC